jgi:hypothetical protein
MRDAKESKDLKELKNVSNEELHLIDGGGGTKCWKGKKWKMCINFDEMMIDYQ